MWSFTKSKRGVTIGLMIRKRRKDDLSVLAYETAARSTYDVESNGKELSDSSAEAVREQDVLTDLGKRIVKTLEEKQTDFVTVSSLVESLAVDEATVRSELMQMTPHIVRRAITFDSKYDDWYRLTSYGLTAQEKRNQTKALVTFQALRNSDY